MTNAHGQSVAPPDPRHLAAAVARAGVDPTAEAKALTSALKRAIADRGGYVCFDVDALGWRVDLLAPEPETFRGRTLAEALAWCLIYLVGPEWGAWASA